MNCGKCKEPVKLTDRQLGVLQCLFDAWVEAELPLIGHMSYGEAFEFLAGLGLDCGPAEERLARYVDRKTVLWGTVPKAAQTAPRPVNVKDLVKGRKYEYDNDGYGYTTVEALEDARPCKNGFRALVRDLDRGEEFELWEDKDHQGYMIGLTELPEEGGDNAAAT
jgi:hypothetical protein